jgi:23S rRNA pseudouridine2604 synthase
MCEYLDYEVTALKRTRIINITLDVPVGRYRDLTDDEIKQLNKLIEPSSKTEEASLPKVAKTDFGNPKKENSKFQSLANRNKRNPNS